MANSFKETMEPIFHGVMLKRLLMQINIQMKIQVLLHGILLHLIYIILPGDIN